VDWIDLAQDMGQWPQSYEHGNEPSGFRKCEECEQLLKKGCSGTKPANFARNVFLCDSLTGQIKSRRSY